ncbi:tRNA (adenosine(37)-N6)-threonylcarbamoyltransferase complex ATPase subunit type 1 TsaE [candidate division WWE3 bacterium CG10_big_fil_rev_8_21_14_0_10_32_10]|uniref:tRNA threonylcarbamoyladenosine biosynthesis protein TsaE n=1 Tax=candidate division WWE3 bacterium CG10_big_fil_rev_8_21_14_0_10_32_10 TaxID=1975090 RepID=A0A2H0RAJ5_UNCKA|nr:MAG: tRNA (adenosine(37)-N6)-threonylcarbamoyltransferase complex ATPase subunit type 1 TsaE [candidate division WWE3 bacterium CG10_big_fil_rev_8_21_14_0_10_32_10]
MEFLAKNTNQNKKIAKSIVDIVINENINIILLKGTLGAGKTTITREIGKLLGVKTNISSPTFVIEKIYIPKKYFSTIHHIDLYRLHSKKEIEEMEILEEVKDKENLYIVEWPDLLLKKIEQNYLLVDIKKGKGNGRTFKIRKKRRWEQDVRRLIQLNIIFISSIISSKFTL